MTGPTKTLAVSIGLLWTLGGCIADGPATRAAGTTRPGHRPMLLIFAADEQDGRLAAQRGLLGSVLPQLEARNVMVVDIVGTDPLRDTFAVPLSGFHVLLVDANDNVLLQLTDIAQPEQITRELDAMSTVGK